MRSARTSIVLSAVIAAWTSIVGAQEELDGGTPSDAGLDATVDAADGAEPSVDAEADAGGPSLPEGVGPIEWAESRGHGCRRSRGRRVCEGPRRVPVPSGEALARQRALGLDQPRVVHHALSAPLPEWVAAAPPDTSTELRWPVQGGRLWRGYGIHRRLRRDRRGRMVRARGRRRHEGVDIGADPGTPILAAGHGLVVYSDNGMSGYGNVVVLVHADGSTTLYAHCSATYVAAGEIVRRGQIIAAVGATGLAHGPHLHFEWRVDGRTRDPLGNMVERPGHEDAEPEPSAEPPE